MASNAEPNSVGDDSLINKKTVLQSKSAMDNIRSKTNAKQTLDNDSNSNYQSALSHQ